MRKKYGSGALIGFCIINSLNELNSEMIQNAKLIEAIFEKDEWGGCNQAYLLSDGMIGVIAHQGYPEMFEDGKGLAIYTNTSFGFDPVTFEVKK